MGWWELVISGRLTEAEALLSEEAAQEKAPGEATLLLASVRTLITHDRKHVEKAAASAGQNVPEDVLMSVLGGTLWDLGFREEGADSLRKAIQANPTLRNLAVAASRFEYAPEHEDDAFSLYQRILAQEPSNCHALVGTGSIKKAKALRFLDEAERAFRAAIQSDPDDPTAHYGMGDLLALQGGHAEGLKEFQTAVHLKYWQPHCAHAGVAFCLQKLGRYKEAADAARESLRIKPDYEYAQNILSELDQSRAFGESK